MATVTLTIPDDQVARINDAFAARFGWTTELGVTKTQFTKAQVIRFVKDVVQTRELQDAEETAKATVMAAALPDVT